MIRDQKISIEQVVFIDFAELSNNKIDLIEISEYYENINIKPVFALDEIQELEDFEKTLVYIYNK